MSWACAACTYENKPEHLVCAMCEEVRPTNTNVIASSSRSQTARSFSAAVASKPSATVVPAKKSTGAFTKPSTSSVPFECKDIKEDDKAGYDFHFVVKRILGHLTAEEIGKAFTIEFEPYTLKRVWAQKYIADKPRHKINAKGVDNDFPPETRVFVEFHPAKGLDEAMRSRLGFSSNKFKRRDEMGEVGEGLDGAYAAPYFVDHHGRGANGKPFCYSAKVVCLKPDCEFAHEPEGWGIRRFDGKPSEESKTPTTTKNKSVQSNETVAMIPASTPSVQTPMSNKPSAPIDPVLEENIKLLKEAEMIKKRKEQEKVDAAMKEQERLSAALVRGNSTEIMSTNNDIKISSGPTAGGTRKVCCNGCGLDRSESQYPVPLNKSEPNYCKACHEKGVPKIECPACLRLKYKSEFPPSSIQNSSVLSSCLECEEEEKKITEYMMNQPPLPSSVYHSHHVRIDFDKGSLLSKNEVMFLLEANVAKVDKLEMILDDTTRTPIGMKVNLLNWNYSTMAPQIRALVAPSAGVHVLVDDRPIQKRVEELLLMVPQTLDEQEFQVLEKFYRSL